MKKVYVFMSIFFMSCSLALQAQTDIPKGFSKGTITLSDGTMVAGYIKENIRGNASVAMITGAGEKKRNFNGNELLAASIDSSRFLCFKGDFFRIVCAGELYFLQKASNASAKAVYNGTEAIFIDGTAGKIDDYFFYDRVQDQLKLLTRKNREEIIAGTFNNCTAAITKARETGDDIARLSQAVEIYNNRNEK